MDPERVRSYLQAACAGLGFDIGEVWWTSNDEGHSTVATIEEENDGGTSETRRPKFVQLYTSKSYCDKRSKLVRPASERNNDEDDSPATIRRNTSIEDLNDHVLSPRLVDAISNTAQVVWANCPKSEGLTGRSDMPFQTAVGMPVAVDANGNMCVVVMFSPNNVHNTEGAMEYLQSISQSATSSSIPCLLPVVDSEKHALLPCTPKSVSHSSLVSTKQVRRQETNLGEGVTAQFVSLNDAMAEETIEIHTGLELTSAPKDCFGIPRLPSFAELGDAKNSPAGSCKSDSPQLSDPFDEASYGVWNTIMNTSVDFFPNSDKITSLPSLYSEVMQESDPADELLVKISNDAANSSEGFESSYFLPNKPTMSKVQRDRLEEFSSAFLGMSVFDAADVYIPPQGDTLDVLTHITSVTSNDDNEVLNHFKLLSANTQIKPWSGAIGRAYASGKPVWSANQAVIVDRQRQSAFQQSSILTSFAVPIFSIGKTVPTCVVGFYSFVQADAVPFVLRFVQQALRLLWEGLDRVEPHASVGKDLWRDVGPADLGEMAADVEMQRAFYKKKRTHNDISTEKNKSNGMRARSSSLSYQLETLGINYDGSSLAPPKAELNTAAQAPVNQPSAAEVVPPSPAEAYTAVQHHVQNAVRSIGDAVQWMPLQQQQQQQQQHQHVNTNEQGSKRAHVITARSSPEMMAHGLFVSQQQTSVPTPPMQPLHQQPLVHSMPQPLPNGKMPILVPSYVPNNTERPQPLVSISYVNHSPEQSIQNAQYVHPTLGKYTDGTNHSLQQIHPQMGSNASVSLLPYQVPSSAYPILLPNSSETRFSVPLVAPSNPASQPSSPPLKNEENSAPPDTVQSNSDTYCLPVYSQVGGTNVPQLPHLDKSGKACRIQGCGDVAVARRPYCLKHSGNRLCENATCTKCAQGSTRFCIAHGGGRRCTFNGCDKGARDKFFCAAHGGGKRCRHGDCSKSAVGGSNLCTSHGGGRRCAIDNCDKSAQSSTKYCVKHGGGKKCSHPTCEKVARGRTLYCAGHGGGVRCKLAGCNRVAIGKLQLCRTHGGGTRSKKKSSSVPRSPSIAIPAVTSMGLGISLGSA